jgi:D-serine dehydratase
MNLEILGRLLMKCDNQLPIAGSIKARGGIYEVLLHAERLALANGLVKTSEDYRAFDSEHFRELFSKHQIYVHCFFAEPTHSPCMVLGMETGLHNGISVQELGIDNQTCADGLAVGRPSAFVGPMMDALLSGVYTVSDDNLYRH